MFLLMVWSCWSKEAKRQGGYLCRDRGSTDDCFHHEGAKNALQTLCVLCVFAVRAVRKEAGLLR